jgi:hypothetical protein
VNLKKTLQPIEKCGSLPQATKALASTFYLYNQALTLSLFFSTAFFFVPIFVTLPSILVVSFSPQLLSAVASRLIPSLFFYHLS